MSGQGKQHHHRRAVDQDGDAIDILASGVAMPVRPDASWESSLRYKGTVTAGDGRSEELPAQECHTFCGPIPLRLKLATSLATSAAGGHLSAGSPSQYRTV